MGLEKRTSARLGTKKRSNLKKISMMKTFSLLLLLICSIIDISIAKPSKHFLIETNDEADVGGSGDGEHGVDYQYADYATFGDYASTVPTGAKAGDKLRLLPAGSVLQGEGN